MAQARAAFWAVLDRDGPAELAHGHELAIGAEAELARDDQQIASPDEPDVIRHWRRRRAERNPKVRKLFFNCPRHLRLHLVDGKVLADRTLTRKRVGRVTRLRRMQRIFMVRRAGVWQENTE